MIKCVVVIFMIHIAVGKIIIGQANLQQNMCTKMFLAISQPILDRFLMIQGLKIK